MPATITVGVIADTHGLLRPEALQALAGVAAILHAGDIGREDIVPRLAEIAPVTAIRGNVDQGTWARVYPEIQDVELAGFRIHMLHDLQQLAINPIAAGVQVVISGHSHRPRIEERNGVLYLNPGSAGPLRFRLPVSLALLRLTSPVAAAELVTLAPARVSRTR